MPDLQQRTTELLQRLIQFNTVNPPGNEQAAQEFLKEMLEAAGFECELLAAVPGRPNLVARLRGGSVSSNSVPILPLVSQRRCPKPRRSNGARPNCCRN